MTFDLRGLQDEKSEHHNIIVIHFEGNMNVFKKCNDNPPKLLRHFTKNNTNLMILKQKSLKP